MSQEINENAIYGEELRKLREDVGIEYPPPKTDAGPQLITGMPEHLKSMPEAPAHEPYIEPEIERERPRPRIIEAQPPIEPKG